MRVRVGGAFLLVGLAVAGCAIRPPPIAPAQAVSLLETGQPLLRCREPCLAAWRAAAEQARQLDMAGRWTELALLIERIGYQDDLTLYYLGRAAEGLGYPGAGASYYRQSTYLSGTAISCRTLSRVCGGVILAQAARLRLAAIERELSRRHPPFRAPLRPAIPPPAVPETPAPPAAISPVPTPPVPTPPGSTGSAPMSPAAAAPSEIAPGAMPPPPPVASAPLAPAAPSAARAAPAGPPYSEYIEPPPALR